MIGLDMSRREYWRFLRRVYEMGALEAWAYTSKHQSPTTRQIREAIR